MQFISWRRNADHIVLAFNRRFDWQVQVVIDARIKARWCIFPWRQAERRAAGGRRTPGSRRTRRVSRRIRLHNWTALSTDVVSTRFERVTRGWTLQHPVSLEDIAYNIYRRRRRRRRILFSSYRFRPVQQYRRLQRWRAPFPVKMKWVGSGRTGVYTYSLMYGHSTSFPLTLTLTLSGCLQSNEIDARWFQT